MDYIYIFDLEEKFITFVQNTRRRKLDEIGFGWDKKKKAVVYSRCHKDSPGWVSVSSQLLINKGHQFYKVETHFSKLAF